MTVTLNLKIDDYTNRVLGVIKEKFGLKNKSEALAKLTDLYGSEFVDKEVKEEVVLEVIASADRHFKRYGLKKMSLEELDRLTGVKE